MVLRTMKNCHSPTTHLAAALLGAAMATTLLTNEPLGLSLTPRLEMDLRETQVRAPASKRMTSLHLAALGSRLSDVGFGFGVASSNSNTHTHARACCVRSTRTTTLWWHLSLIVSPNGTHVSSSPQQGNPSRWHGGCILPNTLTQPINWLIS